MNVKNRSAEIEKGNMKKKEKMRGKSKGKKIWNMKGKELERENKRIDKTRKEEDRDKEI